MPEPRGEPSLSRPDQPRAFENRAARHANACGQAAVASVLAQWRIGPFAHAWARASDAAAIDTVVSTHAPDMPFGLGTTAWRMLSAIRAYGLDVECVHGRDAEPLLRAHLATGAWAPVLLDDGLLGGRAFSAHWAVATETGDEGVTLGNCRWSQLDWGRFRRSWTCRFLPPPHRCCGILTHSRSWLDLLGVAP